MARCDDIHKYLTFMGLILLLELTKAAPTLTMVAEKQLDTTAGFNSLSTKMIQLSDNSYRLCVGGVTTTGSAKFASRDIEMDGTMTSNVTENSPILPTSYTTVSDISVMDSSVNKCFYSVLHPETTTSSYAIVQADVGPPSTNDISLNTNILTVNAASTNQTYLINSATQSFTTAFNSLQISTVTSMCGSVVNASSVMYAVSRKSDSILIGFDGATYSVDVTYTGSHVACDAINPSEWIVCYEATQGTTSTYKQPRDQQSTIKASRPLVSYLNADGVAAVVLQTNLSAIGIVIVDSTLQELLSVQIESTNYGQLVADAMNNVLSVVWNNATGVYVRTYLFDDGLTPTTVNPVPGPVPTNTTNSTVPSPSSPPVADVVPVALGPVTNETDPNAAIGASPSPTNSTATGADAKVLGPAIAIPLAVVAVGVFLLVFFLRKKKKKDQQKKEDSLSNDANLSAINTTDPGRYSAIVSDKSEASHYANIESAATDSVNPTAIQPSEIDKRMQIPYKSLRFTKEIGAGSYGKVFVGEWRGAQVAIKVNNTITDIDGFLGEAKLTLGITPHPNLVQTFGVSLDGPNPCIVLEFCGGGSLDNVVFDPEKHVTDEQRRDYALKIAYGLLHLHNNNIVHRDLAARNILLTNDGQPKISDFGMSRIIQEESSQGRTKTSFGPIRWMAPESLKDKSYSTKSDVWSYGILLYEILSGTEPHVNEDQLSIAVRIRDTAATPVIPSQCDPVLKQVMEMCWKPNPNDRPSMETIAQFLRKH